MNLRKRLIAILYIISFTASIFILVAVIERRGVDVEYTAFSNAAEIDGHLYFSQNLNGKGLLFDLSSKGNVSRIFSSTSIGDDRIAALSVNGENIYMVLSSYIEEADDEGFSSVTAYRIVCLDRKFRLKTQSERFTISEDEVLSGFSAEPTGLFLTMLRKDGSYVKVYCINPSVLVEPEKLSGEEVRVDSVRSKRSDAGRFFVEALYEYGQLYVRTDKDEPRGVFAISDSVELTVAQMRLTIGQFLSLYKEMLVWYLAGVIIWFVLLSLIIKLLADRNRMFYLAVIVEGLLALVTAIGIIGVTFHWENARKTEHSRFAAISMLGLSDEAGISDVKNFGNMNFYFSDTYQTIRQKLVEFIRREGNDDIFYDVMIVRLADDVVVASASGRNLQELTTVYGDDCINLSYSIYRGNRFAVQDLIIEGQKYRAVAIADGIGATNYALVGIINDNSSDGEVWVDNRVSLILFVLFFALGSALVMVVCFLQIRDFRKLETALSDTALGRRINSRPAVISRDLKEMWDAIIEINKRVEELQYSKLRILEAYYRFAPKNIEKILGKNSIVEVGNGEKISTSGTIAMLGIDAFNASDITKIESVIVDIGAFQKEHDSILVGKAPDMSRIQLMFLEKEKGTVNFFTQMFNNNQKSGDKVNFSTVLFYDECRFGVLGNEDEASTYLYYSNKLKVEEITAFITSLSLGLVITEEIKNRENVAGPLRFIGFMGKEENGEKIRLYEVLDACPVVIRKQKIATLNKFKEALAQYYEKDFYLSRTSFSEILKDTPDDLLVKWYVFESDRYLNENVNGEDYMNLHM